MSLTAADDGNSNIKVCGYQYGSEGNVDGKLGHMGTKSLLFCGSMTGSLQTLLNPRPAGSQLLRKSSSPYLWPKARSMHWGPCGNFKFSSFGQLQVSFIAESLGFKVLFPTSCRAVFLSHVLPSPTLLACAPAVPWLSLLFLHAVPLLATLPPFVSTSLPSILPFHCLHPSQLTLYCHTPDFLKFWQVSKMGIGKPTYYYTLSSGKNPVTLSPPLSTIFLLFVLAALLPTLKLQTLWGQCQNLVWIL